MKKVISLFLSAMMILTSVLCVNFSAFAKDIESGSIKLGKNTVKVSEFDETNSTYYWYSFVPDETAVYNFESHYTVSDNTDPVIYLCDKNKNEIADHDDIGGRENRNFRLKTSLIKGETYYLYFREYNDLTSFEFSVDKTKINFSFTFAKKHTLTQGYDSYIRTDDNSDEYDHYNFWNVIYSEGNTLTVTKKGGTPVTYTCKNTKANEDDEDNFSFVDSDGNHFDYELDFYTSQSKNHLKPGKNVQCSFRVYNIDVPFTVDIDENPIASIEYIGNITVSDKDKHTDDDGDYYYDYTIYQPGAKIVIHYKNNTSDTYICKGFYNEDEMDYGFINVNDSEDWLDVDYRADTPIWTAGGNNLIYIMCHSVITTIPVTVIPSTPVPNPTPNPTPAPSPAPAQPVPAPSTSTSAPAAQTIAQPAAPKNNKKVKVASAKAGKKSVKVTWKKVKGIKGYQIQYSTNKKFKKGNKTITVKSTKSTSATIKKLKSKKKYYVRMRTYKVVNGKKVYSAWSKAKSVKVK